MINNLRTRFRKLLWSLGTKLYSRNNLPCGNIIENDIKEETPLSEMKVIMDIGANLGQAAFMFNELFPDSLIYSFEPIPHVYEKLEQGIDGRNIKPFKIGFGAENKMEKVYLQSRSICNSISPVLNKPDKNMQNESVMIDIRTLDSFCIENKIERIDLLKIDTEGFEMEVLEGAKKTLASGIVRYVYIETSFNPDLEPRYTSFYKVNEILKKNGFRVRAFYNQCTNDKTHMAYVDALFINPNNNS